MSTEAPPLDQFQDADEKEIEQKMIKTILGMPKEVQARFKVLHMLSDKRSKLNDEFNEACKKLEAKILEKKKPFLDQRKQIIAGELEQYGDLIPRFDDAHKELEKKVAAIVKPEGEEAEVTLLVPEFVNPALYSALEGSNSTGSSVQIPGTVTLGDTHIRARQPLTAPYTAKAGISPTVFLAYDTSAGIMNKAGTCGSAQTLSAAPPSQTITIQGE